MDKQVKTEQSQDFHAYINSQIKDESLLVQYYELMQLKLKTQKL